MDYTQPREDVMPLKAVAETNMPARLRKRLEESEKLKK
jgi:hypothetical protein